MNIVEAVLRARAILNEHGEGTLAPACHDFVHEFVDTLDDDPAIFSDTRYMETAQSMTRQATRPEYLIDFVKQLSALAVIPLLVKRAQGRLDKDEAGIIAQLAQVPGPDPVWILVQQDSSGNTNILAFANEDDAKKTGANIGALFCALLPVAPAGTVIEPVRQSPLYVPTHAAGPQPLHPAPRLIVP